MKTYTHQFFGPGYELYDEAPDGWCSLKKEEDDGIVSYAADFKQFLIEDRYMTTEDEEFYCERSQQDLAQGYKKMRGITPTKFNRSEIIDLVGGAVVILGIVGMFLFVGFGLS